MGNIVFVLFTIVDAMANTLCTTAAAIAIILLTTKVGAMKIVSLSCMTADAR